MRFVAVASTTSLSFDTVLQLVCMCTGICVFGVCVCVYPLLQVGFDDNGHISGILLNMYTNSGFVDNDNSFVGNFLYGFIDNGQSPMLA